MLSSNGEALFEQRRTVTGAKSHKFTNMNLEHNKQAHSLFAIRTLGLGSQFSAQEHRDPTQNTEIWSLEGRRDEPESNSSAVAGNLIPKGSTSEYNMHLGPIECPIYLLWGPSIDYISTLNA